MACQSASSSTGGVLVGSVLGAQAIQEVADRGGQDVGQHGCEILAGGVP